MSIIEKAAKRLAEKQGKAAVDAKPGRSKDGSPQGSDHEGEVALNPFSDSSIGKGSVSTKIQTGRVGKSAAPDNPFESWDGVVPPEEGTAGKPAEKVALDSAKEASTESQAAGFNSLVEQYGNRTKSVGDESPYASGQPL